MPRVLLFVIAPLLLPVAAVLIATASETGESHSGSACCPRAATDPSRSACRPVFLAGSVLLATRALGGYHHSFGPPMRRKEVRSSRVRGRSRFLLAACASRARRTACRSPLTSNRSAREDVLIVLGIRRLAIVVSVHSAVASIAIGAVAGIARSIATSGSMRTLPHAATEDRAGWLAFAYGISYPGAAVTGLIAGRSRGRHRSRLVARSDVPAPGGPGPARHGVNGRARERTFALGCHAQPGRFRPDAARRAGSDQRRTGRPRSLRMRGRPFGRHRRRCLFMALRTEVLFR